MREDGHMAAEVRIFVMEGPFYTTANREQNKDGQRIVRVDPIKPGNTRRVHASGLILMNLRKLVKGGIEVTGNAIVSISGHPCTQVEGRFVRGQKVPVPENKRKCSTRVRKRTTNPRKKLIALDNRQLRWKMNANNTKNTRSQKDRT